MSDQDLLSNQFKVTGPDTSVSSGISGSTSIDSGERKLAALGYTQQLNRGFNTFTNFAVSFSIISIVTGITGGLLTSTLGLKLPCLSLLCLHWLCTFLDQLS